MIRGDALELMTTALDGKHSQPRYSDLHWAAIGNNVAAAELLLENGASLDVLDEMQMTPLHRAVVRTRKQPSVAAFLLSRGAAVATRNGWGGTPLVMASQCGNAASVKLLVGSGAELSAATHHGIDFSHMAESSEVFAIGAS